MTTTVEWRKWNSLQTKPVTNYDRIISKTPKELYAAMGFPPDYIIERDYTGKPYPKSAQVARCGNAVCPQMASAVVRANMPEWSVTITTMAALHKMVAV